MTERFLTLALPDDLVEAFAERVAEIIASRQPDRGAPTPWLYGQRAAAEYLGCGLDRVKRLTAARAIPHHKQDGRVFYHRDELDEWLNLG
jgi:excisionase family DNA binding protein